MAGIWRIDPLVSPLHAVTAPDRRCGLPKDMAHCHGWETQHVDGIAECLGHCECDAPSSGRHVQVHLCERELTYLYSHRRDRCR